MSDASDRHTSGSTGTSCLLRMGRFFFSVSSVLLHLPLPDFLPVLPAVRLCRPVFSVLHRAAPSRLAPADGTPPCCRTAMLLFCRAAFRPAFSVPFRAAPSRLAPADGCRRFTALPYCCSAVRLSVRHFPSRSALRPRALPRRTAAAVLPHCRYVFFA